LGEDGLSLISDPIREWGTSIGSRAVLVRLYRNRKKVWQEDLPVVYLSRVLAFGPISSLTNSLERITQSTNLAILYIQAGRSRTGNGVIRNNHFLQSCLWGQAWDRMAYHRTESVRLEDKMLVRVVDMKLAFFRRWWNICLAWMSWS
jgi:hypothetical protein